MSDSTGKESEKEGKQNGISDDKNTQPNAKPKISTADLDRMVADSLKDIDVDEEDDGDLDDPELLKELSEIIEPHHNHQDVVKPSADVILPTSDLVPELLKNRIEMYKTAEANAVAANESGRARRFGRGLSTMETMLNEALAGKSVKIEDIPPEVIMKKPDGLNSPPNSPSSEAV